MSGGDTLCVVLPLEGGGELRFHAVHGRLDLQVRVGKGRTFNTTPLTAERGEYVAERLTEIAKHARAQRQSRGA